MEQGEGAQFPHIGRMKIEPSEEQLTGQESDLFERVSARIRKAQQEGRLK
jgi:hypothetical protein